MEEFQKELAIFSTWSRGFGPYSDFGINFNMKGCDTMTQDEMIINQGSAMGFGAGQILEVNARDLKHIKTSTDALKYHAWHKINWELLALTGAISDR